MKKIDRCLISWAQGNKKTRVREYILTRESVFQNGVIIASRSHNADGKPIIIMRTHVGDAARTFKIDTIICPQRHFGNKQVYYVDGKQFIDIVSKIRTIEGNLAASAKGNWKKHIALCLSLGRDILDLRRLCRDAKIYEEFFSDCDSDILEVVGCKTLFKGRVQGICHGNYRHINNLRPEITKHRGVLITEYLTTHTVIFEKFDDAVMFHLKYQGGKLFEI